MFQDHVPLSNYLGWFFSTLAIVFVNQRFDRWLSEREGEGALGFHLPFKPFWTLGSCVGNFLFINGIAVSLLLSDQVPGTEPVGAVLTSGLVIMAAFIAFAVHRIRRGLERGNGLA